MSYSRWHNSTFYTYYKTSNSSKKNKQLFACAIDPIFVNGEYVEFEIEYSTLKKNRNSFLEKCLTYFNEEEKKTLSVELNSYIDRFLKDIEEQYNEKGF